MSAVGEFVELAYDDAVCAWHEWRRDTHARALAAATARRRARVAAWARPAPDRPSGGAS